MRIMLPVLALAAVSCQQQHLPDNGSSVGIRHYSDAVVHIGQVDPAYQAYFRAQNGANFSIGEQRKAYIAAARTARTPVRETDYRPSVARRSNKVSSAKRRTASRKNSTAGNRTAMIHRRRSGRR